MPAVLAVALEGLDTLSLSLSIVKGEGLDAHLYTI